MSQKPYVWNRNDPYSNSDPSGYDPVVIEDPKAANFLGHLRLAIIDHQTGLGLLYTQGPEHSNMPSDKELIQVQVITMERLRAMAKQNGWWLATVTTSSAEDLAMNDRASLLLSKNATGNVNYNVLTNNCDQFVQQVLMQADPWAAAALGLDPTADFLGMLMLGAAAEGTGQHNQMHTIPWPR